MLTARERTRRAIYSQAAPWMHSIKTAKHHLEKGDTATAFPTRSQTSPQVIHYTLLKGGRFLPSRDKKIICRGGNTYLNFILEKNNNNNKNINGRARLQHLEQQRDLRRRWREREEPWGSSSERGRGAVAVPPFPAAGMTMREHPLPGTAGNCSQETEVLKLENRCQRK